MQDQCWISLKCLQLHVSEIQCYLECWYLSLPMQTTEQAVCVYTKTSYRKWWSLGRNRKIEYYIYLIECADRVTWAYLELTVLGIYWLNELTVLGIYWLKVTYFKYMFWPSRVFYSTCEKLALLSYSFTLWFATTVVIFNNNHHSWQFRIQFNTEVVQVSTELFGNGNMTGWFSLLSLWLWRSCTFIIIT